MGDDDEGEEGLEIGEVHDPLRPGLGLGGMNGPGSGMLFACLVHDNIEPAPGGAGRTGGGT